MPEITIVVFVALGAFLTGSGVTGFVAFKAVRIGWELALDDRRLEPGAVGELPSPRRPVGEASGRHHKPQASDGPPPDEDVWRKDPVWPTEEVTA
jgi:hypothetical protein